MGEVDETQFNKPHMARNEARGMRGLDRLPSSAFTEMAAMPSIS
jgi:hypothetical protein